MTRMTDGAERRRAEVENALAGLARARLLLRAQVTLRVRQATERDERLCGLLKPALDYLAQVDAALDQAQAFCSAEWRNGQQSGWRAGKK